MPPDSCRSGAGLGTRKFISRITLPSPLSTYRCEVNASKNEATTLTFRLVGFLEFGLSLSETLLKLVHGGDVIFLARHSLEREHLRLVWSFQRTLYILTGYMALLCICTFLLKNRGYIHLAR